MVAFFLPLKKYKNSAQSAILMQQYRSLQEDVTADADRLLWNSLERTLQEYILSNPVTSERTRISSRDKGKGKLLQVSLPDKSPIMPNEYHLTSHLHPDYLQQINMLPLSSHQYINALGPHESVPPEIFLNAREKRNHQFFELSSLISREKKDEAAFRRELFYRIHLLTGFANHIYQDCIEPYTSQPEQLDLWE